MSLFRKPKKIQRRVFTSELSEDGEDGKSNHRLDIDGEDSVISQPSFKLEKKKEKSQKQLKIERDEKQDKQDKSKAKSLLSFADDEDDSEVFQVRKSSNSKKIMRMMDKERRKKRREEREGAHKNEGSGFGSLNADRSDERERRSNMFASTRSEIKSSPSNSSLYEKSSSISNIDHNINKKCENIQTEIRTDDFVLVVKKSEPELILNGRAALCAGRDDVSDEDIRDSGDEDHEETHNFSKPEHLRKLLESGSIPDAAMIHAARKRRQKAREQGEFIPVEEQKMDTKKGSRLAREDIEGDNSDEEDRMDMNAITGVKEREERREQFYSVENDYLEDSDHETHEWENQQIRKGVTGAQLTNVQNDSVLSRFVIKSSHNAIERSNIPPSTATLLEQAYAKTALDKSQQIFSSTKEKNDKSKVAPLRTPKEIRDNLKSKLVKLKELNEKHREDIDRITNELNLVQLEKLDCQQKAPIAAAKYKFYQEIKCYVADLIDCLNEKTPLINDLEKRAMSSIAKHENYLIERRRQDVRDQVKEMAEASKPSTQRVGLEYDEMKRRAAEREGRRTRRRCEREKNELSNSHLDGMSSDEETSDQYQEQLQITFDKLKKEAGEILTDVNDEFCHIEFILMKFYAWRKTEIESYKDAYVSLCIPKMLSPLIRLELVLWSPLMQEYKEIEKMDWYNACMLYAWDKNETEDSLKDDPDLNLVPKTIEKIILAKLTEIVKICWDPLSTSQTLRLIGFINRVGRDYPLKESSKIMQHLFDAVLEKMRLALENDVFIPIFPKQVQEAKSSFFQRQFCSGLKLFRNFLSWQGILADEHLYELAISSLLNRYLLLAMRVCSPNDAINKAYIIVNTLPTVWLQPNSVVLDSLQLLIAYIKTTLENCDAKKPLFMQSCDKAKQILQRLHSY